MSVLKSSLFSFAGSVIPALAALFTVPVIVSHLGAETYGVYALITSIVGYFALIDINMTAGSVKFVSEYEAKGDRDSLARVITLGGLIYLSIGIAGSVGLWWGADWLVRDVFNVPARIEGVAHAALRVAAVGFLLGQMQVYLQSVIEALRRYDVSSKLEASFGTATALATVAVVLLGGDLHEMLMARVALSALNICTQCFMLNRLLPGYRPRRPSREILGGMATYSTYAYLSKLASISAANSDKLLVGALQDMTALAMYSVPLLLAARVFGLVYKLGQVVFPYASALHATQQRQQLEALYFNASRYISFLNACMCLMLVLFAPELLHYWAGKVFGTEAVFVLTCLGLAVFIDSLTNIPSLVNDGMGNPRITGISAVLRAATSIAFVYAGLKFFGVRGAAVAQLIVASMFTTVFLFVVHRQTLRIPLAELVKRAYLPLLPVLAVSVAVAFFGGQQLLKPAEFLASAVVVVSSLVFYGIAFVVLPEDRRRLASRLAALTRAGEGRSEP
jgi:O-antigen/teichoic acid export membrane protein